MQRQKRKDLGIPEYLFVYTMKFFYQKKKKFLDHQLALS